LIICPKYSKIIETGCDMPFKPLDVDVFLKYLKLADWELRKGGIDFNLYDETGIFISTIKIAHGKDKKL
jgi:hypothetical protein